MRENIKLFSWNNFQENLFLATNRTEGKEFFEIVNTSPDFEDWHSNQGKWEDEHQNKEHKRWSLGELD